MYEGSLFEKLTKAFEDQKYGNQEILYHSIANNLSNIFSTNAGSSLACENYGKPELNDINLSLEESLVSISKSFSSSILEYEPRLHDISVKAVSHANNLSKIDINITGYMRVNHQNHKVRYKAYISGDGTIEVQK